MPQIALKLTVDETNLVLEGLGNLAFGRVYALVAKIQAQAAEQINTRGEGRETGAAPAPTSEPTP